MTKKGIAGLCGAVLLAVLTFEPSSSEAATYFVDNVHGSDTQTGTSSGAWQSLRHATSQLTAGDTLVVVSNGPARPYREQLQFFSSGVSGQPIRVVGSNPDAPTMIVGSADLSDRAGNRWYPEGGGIYTLDLAEQPHSLWVTTRAGWEASGINALNKRDMAPSYALQPGQWSYVAADQALFYAVRPGETIDSIHIEGVTSKLLMDVSRRQHLTIENLSFKLSAKTALAIQKSSGHIELRGIDVSQVVQNAVIVSSSSEVHISDCRIDDAGNNGIVFNGSAENPVSDSSITGCKITRVLDNDCITLHKNSEGQDVGSNILIQGNQLSGCHEQGIDVTSGSDVTLADNVTQNNGDSGIVLGHGVRRVEVSNHVSVDDGRFAGLLINDAYDVQVSGSCIIGSEKHQLQIFEGHGITLSNNVFYQPRHLDGSVLDIGSGSSDITFVQNHVVSESDSEVVLLRYLQGATPEANGVSYYANVWSAPEQYARRFYTDGAGKHAFDDHEQLFERSASDSFVSDMTLADLAFQVSVNRCDLRKAARGYMTPLLSALEAPVQVTPPAEPPTPTQTPNEPDPTPTQPEPGPSGPSGGDAPTNDSEPPGSSSEEPTSEAPSSQDLPPSTGNGAPPGADGRDGGSELAPGDWTTVTGNVFFVSEPVCALVLVNGQSQFTCDGDGRFDLFVPVDKNSNVTVMAFADGFAPVTKVLKPSKASELQIDMARSVAGVEFAVDASANTTLTAGRASVSGTITYGDQPVCALVLANGQDMFSCGDEHGVFQLDVPLDADGNVELMVFVSGFKPYQRTLSVIN